MEEEYEYDVAFSFTYEDELLASQLNDYVQPSFKTFIYFDKQNELAARDGEVEFNAVFNNKARLVVILFCEKWGDTPFTRIEQTAIRNRGFEQGYDFTIMLPLRGAKPPDWFPKNRLYLNLEKYGAKTLAAVIESKIQELGGESTSESAIDLAKRIKRANEIKGEIYKYSHSSKAVADGIEEFRTLANKFQESWSELKKMEIGFGLGEPKINDIDGGGQLIIEANGIMLQFTYRTHFSNSLDDNELTIVIFEPPSMWKDNKTKVLKKEIHSFGLDELLRKGWKNTDEFSLTCQLVDRWSKSILEFAKEKN